MYNNEKIPVIEIYTCIQGEGKYMGIPHIMIRTTGCKLRCQFKDSFCDTPYASWSPEKAKYSWQDLYDFYNNRNVQHIKHTVISGGGPTLHRDFLIKVCEWLVKSQGQFVTIETEGSEYVQTDAQFISLSPKLKNSIPKPGIVNPFTDKVVTEEDKKQHLKWYRNTEALEFYMNEHNVMNWKDYQFKFVVSDEDDINEIEELQWELSIPNDRIWLMPEGITDEQLQEKRKMLVEYCVDNGYNYSDRLQIIIYGNQRGV